MKKVNILLGVLLAFALTTTLAYGIGGSGWNIAEGVGWQFEGLVRFQDDITAYQTLTVISDTNLDADLNLQKQTRIVVTNGSTITPIGAYAPISSTAATGTSSITAGNTGDMLLLHNIGGSTITLTDTGNLQLAGNAILTATDSILLIFDGTNWVELASPHGN